MILYCRYYIKTCSTSTYATDLSVFRIISLWLANQLNPKLSLPLEKLSNIPSYKFLPAITQISARLSCENKSDQLLSQIIERCAIDHPHHVLNQIFSIANSYEDAPSPKTRNEPRVQCAKSLINKLKNNTNISLIVNQTEIMCKQLIKFANTFKLPTNKSKYIDGIKNLDAIHCPTIELPVSPNGDYKNIVGIVKWSNEFEKLHGINEPKKIECQCTDGITRSQLLKGKDDLRQDAVMQQVFSIINTLITVNRETNERKLKIRTYKVVPLSQRSGILEWCENTIPIGVYLVGSGRNDKGAHVKYRPTDMKPSDCRNIMLKNHSQPKLGTADKLKSYNSICENFKPVFHYFFFERYHNPGVWFERRMAYVNSVATSSMIGYILGLGDRHVQNILIDQTTAEVIHIDFGIAFEQGKVLPTPETVPFRLTRDMVAPMGISGVEGFFKKSCEKTLKILRQNNLLIPTILEVLLYDPLYAWKLSAKAAYSKQSIEVLDNPSGMNNVQDDKGERNLTAERALIRVKEKLMGKEYGATGMSTVEAQIDRLVEQAINPSNLCKLFPGWQPYL